MALLPRYHTSCSSRPIDLVTLSVAWLLLCSLGAIARGQSASENLARKAEIEASSEYSGGYLARFVADGRIPKPESRQDTGQAWAAKGKQHPDGVQLEFRWPQPERIAEVIYFGRTAFEWQENWKDFEVYIDSNSEPAVRGQLKIGHGPQPIRLPKTVQATCLTIKFLTSYGGSNPGASEIQVFAVPQRASSFGSLITPNTFAAQRGQRAVERSLASVPENADLKRQVQDGVLGFSKLVVVQRREINPTHVYTYHTEGQKAGGGLYVVDLTRNPPRLTRLIDASDGLVLDANLSYDGTTILFSWKRHLDQKLQLYTIRVDGSELRQITQHDSNNLNGCWLPDGGIAFLSDRKPAYAYCWTSSTPILYRCNADGSQIERLSANYLNDFTPSVMDDGRILYSRWEYVDRPAIPIQSLWSINPDGTGLAGFFGNRVLSPATFMEAHEIPGTRQVLCVLTSHNGPCRGAIGIVDPTKGANSQQSIRNLTPEVEIGAVDLGNGNQIKGPYESPFPLSRRHYLVTLAGTILLRDYEGTNQVTLLPKQDELGFYSARPVMPRPRPALRPSLKAESTGEWATILLQDIYDGLEPHVQRGEVKQVAVVQELEKSKFADVSQRAFGFQFPVVSCGATYAPKKIWGYATIEEDGSAHFRVPTRVPIYFMALDREGRAVQRMRSFTHLMPGEKQNCVGCHANRSHLTPRSRQRPLASLREAEELATPEWGLGGFSYAHVVQPVLDLHCVECHSAKRTEGGLDLSSDRTDFFNVSYEQLARQGQPGLNPYTKWIPTFNGQEANILRVEPKYWGSPASRLAEVILSGHPDKNGRRQVDVPLAGRRRVFTWIDLDVPYYGTSESNHYDLPGCRQMVPPNLDAVLKDVAARRCNSCHQQPAGIPRKPYVRITNVHNNAFLLAPLAVSAGGTGRCGTTVFKSKNDPYYRAILETFTPTNELLRERPRMDLVNDPPPTVCPL
jgi:hypothetical protein